MSNTHTIEDNVGQQSGRSDLGDENVASNWPVLTANPRKLRKQSIKAVRKEKAANRGLDLSAIDSLMEDIVRMEVDMHYIEHVTMRDREQVTKLASIYGLRSTSQGRGKKLCIVVRRTRHTRIPDGLSRDRLMELLAFNSLQPPPSSRKGTSIDPSARNRARSKTKRQLQGVNGRSKLKRSEDLGRTRSKSTTMQPLLFVPRGVMEPVSVTVMNSAASFTSAAPSSTFGSFECYTKGFGSRIMAKLGFVVGAGLGKDENGIATPIEVIKRPQSLGLGAHDLK